MWGRRIERLLLWPHQVIMSTASCRMAWSMLPSYSRISCMRCSGSFSWPNIASTSRRSSNAWGSSTCTSKQRTAYSISPQGNYLAITSVKMVSWWTRGRFLQSTHQSPKRQVQVSVLDTSGHRCHAIAEKGHHQHTAPCLSWPKEAICGGSWRIHYRSRSSVFSAAGDAS